MTAKTGEIAAIVAESFDFLVDAKKRLIGLEVEPKDGDAPFVLPMSYETAEHVGMNLLKMLLFHAPEMTQGRLAVKPVPRGSATTVVTTNSSQIANRRTNKLPAP